ncbi:Taurine catabolism dioxygenase TauD/TfdA [Penicillium brevicompactum]|uniref:Taurine catabolism dioxygenase TauD/TfdA n=1 Tax=Penicillium brevicompactum TaxID=5074 RepID=A0A9W9UNU8_PENBR|nr:Taurine catabolism dioxygenase TauD/TfdA [Penicillium brevicompactum]KAJ5332213.1 Taurine catabolism dioxygenase TauD/TfdA [Penicillium brevicompactum]KAJ5351219.1 Taurine catabolism dioxygenase TauD/TfdA [Penicillium brevicompactum]KAJ5361175.1 Taurine catabolism dioxygenase TauD/TfdA [Penicillium brevicompactum]
MAAVTETSTPVVPIVDEKITLKGLAREPLKSNGSLDAFESFDVTPVIGREFPNASLKDFLRAPNSDDLLRELSLTISQRGVVFFRKQDGLDDDLQKELVQRLGELSGKPSTSGLHIHPVANSGREHSVKDDEISVISSAQRKTLYKDRNLQKQSARREWHSDITFEPIPSDYTLLRLTELPRTGGDTLWASGYEVYDRISEPYQKFLETLTATYAQPRFNEVAKNNDFKIHPGPRGAPENVGEELKAQHPVIRTNPVTGWKSVFAVGSHVQKIDGLSEEESRHLLQWFITLIVENHDLQVRLRWQNPNDLAIWDNRSVYHAATWDYEEIGPRTGHRAVGLGERPYLDPKSIGRREALAADE